MAYLIIEGGKKLSGTVANQSAKNAAMPILCAAVMIKGVVTLSKVPQIEEVERMIELLVSIGVKVAKPAPGTLVIDASEKLMMERMDRRAAEMIRSSLYLLGALSHREKDYKLFRSGGCKLGHRTVRPHLLALEKLGIKVHTKPGCYKVENGKSLKGAEIVMYESSDMATGNAIMAAVLAKGETIIKMASANYSVQDLCYFLIKAGAKIKGVGTTTLTIEGVTKLHPVAEYSIMPDPIVAMTLISTAIATRSHLTVKDCPLEFLELELYKLEIMGQKLHSKNKHLSESGAFTLVDIEVIPSKLKALPDKIECRPFPGLNIDNLPLFIPILALAEGRTMVHDWVYEDRAIYSLELKKLGANINLIDTHRVWVEGPTSFVPNEVVAPPALRPAMNVLIAMLAAKGRSILRNTYIIDRGYENIYETLRAAGAKIQVINDK
jgi:UDP-N-acetylglucosamine 1-carboxyvinyltransferase